MASERGWRGQRSFRSVKVDAEIHLRALLGSLDHAIAAGKILAGVRRIREALAAILDGLRLRTRVQFDKQPQTDPDPARQPCPRQRRSRK